VDKENGNRRRNRKGKIAPEKVQMARSRVKKEKRKREELPGNNKRAEIGD
jgi:hypothetical protein